MICLCGRHSSGNAPLCSTCTENHYRGESILKPVGEVATLIKRTSIEDYALFVIALNRQQKEQDVS